MANALRSGADSALLYDALASDGRLDRYPQAEGRARALASLGAATTAVLGGILAEVDLRLPYAAAIAMAGVAVTQALRLPERRTGEAGPRAGRDRYMRDALRAAAADGTIRWTMALAVVAVVSSHVYYFLQQPYLAAIGVPLWAFGVVFAATKVVTALTAALAHRLDAARSPRSAAAIMLLVPSLGLAAMAVVTRPVGALLIVTRGLLDGLWEPLLNVYMNRLAEPRLRATLLSLQNLTARLALAGALAALGVVTGPLGVHGALGASAAVVAVSGALLVLRRPAR
jgi:hypothetical protein